MRRILIIGNSSGIGLSLTQKLLAEGEMVTGISRSPSPLLQANYHHQVFDVGSPNFRSMLEEVLVHRGPFDIGIYCAGIGGTINVQDFSSEVNVFQVNLLAALTTAQVIIPSMLRQGSGHLVVLSSLADELISPEVPSYCASKAAMSSYFESLALTLRPKGIAVTNIRFGFVDTKMAKAPVRPFMISADKAASIILRALKKRPIRLSYPLPMVMLVRLFRWGLKLRVWCG